MGLVGVPTPLPPLLAYHGPLPLPTQVSSFGSRTICTSSGALRVEFKTDAKNERARAALAAIPAEFEGIHRKHMIVRNGERRDSAWYAVIDDDWPDVKAALERRIAAAE